MDASPILPPRPLPSTSVVPLCIEIHVWVGKDFKIPKFTSEFPRQGLRDAEREKRKDLEQWRRNPLRHQFALHVGKCLIKILKFKNEETPFVIVVEEDGAESKEFFSHLSRH
jgi:hypothetical protein